MSDLTIGYAGLSHLGIVSAVAAAARGVSVVAYDSDPRLTATLTRGELPIDEPGLAECLDKWGSRLTFTSDISKLKGCQVVYVARDVPTDETGRSDLAPVRQLVEDIIAAAGDGSSIVVLSQVPPGFTRSLSRPGVRLTYQVETLVFGRALARALNPERFIVGVPSSGDGLDEPLGRFLSMFDCPILVMRYESAELAKISINAMLVASISAANTLAELCEAIGADWSEISPSLRLDARIGGASYIDPGLGLAGGNLERDLDTIMSLADRHGTDAGVVKAWVANSRHRRAWVADQLRRVADGQGPDRIAVWGLAYKQDTHSTKNSVGVELVRSLVGRDVTWYDPLVDGRALGLPGDEAATALDAARGADVLCITTPWAEFSTVAPSTLVSVMRGRTVIDPYGLLDLQQAADAGLRHSALGRPSSADQGSTR